jgi:hypothetical protein
MLWEILLRLPPQPSSLPRASAVCRRWRGLLTDPRFLRLFRAHHRKPPLLGVFQSCDIPSLITALMILPIHSRWIEFNSILEPHDHWRTFVEAKRAMAPPNLDENCTIVLSIYYF